MTCRTRSQKKNNLTKNDSAENTADAAAAAPAQTSGQTSARISAAAPAAPGETASKFGTGSSETVEGLPTVMLDGGTGSFIGDIINMAKYTRNLYKKK